MVELAIDFDLPHNVREPDDADVKSYAAKATLKGKSDDVNATQWVKDRMDGSADSLDGAWHMRQALTETEGEPRSVDDRHGPGEGGGRSGVPALQRRHRGMAVRGTAQGQKLIGRYLNLRDPKDALPWFGLIVDGKRIRRTVERRPLDLRRKLK